VTQPSFQELMPRNHCWGCGAANPVGLGIRSRWIEPGRTAQCEWTPRPEHMAGPTSVLNGGIVATLIDCHGICTAIANGYLAEDREIGSEPVVWCATGSLQIRYVAPSPLGPPVAVTATIDQVDDRKTWVTCALTVEGRERARGRVLAVRVPPEWLFEGPST
jgi:acyl-coenzyme A thioesterase PaaI-like protein